MNFNKPIFTIITPTLNNKIELLKTINSIKAQKFNNFEFIVVDGGSTDGTIEVLKESKIITKWISEKDKGIYDAINKGIKFSDGKYINTINSGDTYFSENSLSIIKDYFDKNDISFVFGAVQKDIIHYKYKPKKMNWSFNFYPAHSGGFFVKKEVHDKIGLYDLKYPCSSDYDFFWRMIKKNKFSGLSTKKEEIISIFAPGGFSSKYSFFEHLVEEMLIRINNGQNKILVLIIFFLRCIKGFNKI
jgi:glycosyltransferase involved in cell wall biosynthesis